MTGSRVGACLILEIVAKNGIRGFLGKISKDGHGRFGNQFYIRVFECLIHSIAFKDTARELIACQTKLQSLEEANICQSGQACVAVKCNYRSQDLQGRHVLLYQCRLFGAYEKDSRFCAHCGGYRHHGTSNQIGAQRIHHEVFLCVNSKGFVRRELHQSLVLPHRRVRHGLGNDTLSRGQHSVGQDHHDDQRRVLECFLQVTVHHNMGQLEAFCALSVGLAPVPCVHSISPV
mmetsp:Transcript_36632/g.88771  ORF Transcript_36632/g.88771 Transcript_36632/m.88771 type:complete len:232 (-) Transcript_36632:249-944(-)